MSDRHTAALILALYEADAPLMMKSLQKVTNHTQTLRQRLDSMADEGVVSAILYGVCRLIKLDERSLLSANKRNSIGNICHDSEMP